MKQQSMLITVILVCVGTGIGFFGGMKYVDYQRTQVRQIGGRQFQGANTNGQMQNRAGLGGRPVTGEIINKDDTSITVKTVDGGSRIIILSATTTYSKTASATKEDLTVGANVGVFGSENKDKSMTAQNIQLNPQFRMGSTGSAQSKPTK
jgi:hypothetical protein